MQISCMKIAAAAALQLGLAGRAFADASGYTSEITGHTLGDPTQCTKGDQCGNIGGTGGGAVETTLKSGGGATCKADEAGHSKCVADAAAACDGDQDCFAFIVPATGHSGSNWAICARPTKYAAAIALRHSCGKHQGPCTELHL